MQRRAGGDAQRRERGHQGRLRGADAAGRGYRRARRGAHQVGGDEHEDVGRARPCPGHGEDAQRERQAEDERRRGGPGEGDPEVPRAAAQVGEPGDGASDHGGTRRAAAPQRGHRQQHTTGDQQRDGRDEPGRLRGVPAHRVQDPAVRAAERDDRAHQQQVRRDARHLHDGDGDHGPRQRQPAADEVTGVDGHGAEPARRDAVGGRRGELRQRRLVQRDRPPGRGAQRDRRADEVQHRQQDEHRQELPAHVRQHRHGAARHGTRRGRGEQRRRDGGGGGQQSPENGPAGPADPLERGRSRGASTGAQKPGGRRAFSAGGDRLHTSVIGYLVEEYATPRPDRRERWRTFAPAAPERKFSCPARLFGPHQRFF